MRAVQLKVDFLRGVELAIEISPENTHHGLRCRLAYLIGHFESTHPEISGALKRLDVELASRIDESQS